MAKRIRRSIVNDQWLDRRSSVRVATGYGRGHMDVSIRHRSEDSSARECRSQSLRIKQRENQQRSYSRSLQSE
jgi:hypothetical protein